MPERGSPYLVVRQGISSCSVCTSEGRSRAGELAIRPVEPGEDRVSRRLVEARPILFKYVKGWALNPNSTLLTTRFRAGADWDEVVSDVEVESWEVDRQLGDVGDEIEGPEANDDLDPYEGW